MLFEMFQTRIHNLLHAVMHVRAQGVPHVVTCDDWYVDKPLIDTP